MLLNRVFEVAEEGHAAERYAVSLSAEEQAHLSVFMVAPIFRVPGSGLLPLSHALVDEINAKRRAHAEEAERRIANATTIAGITAEFSCRSGLLCEYARSPRRCSTAE